MTVQLQHGIVRSGQTEEALMLLDVLMSRAKRFNLVLLDSILCGLACMVVLAIIGGNALFDDKSRTDGLNSLTERFFGCLLLVAGVLLFLMLWFYHNQIWAWAVYAASAVATGRMIYKESNRSKKQ